MSAGARRHRVAFDAPLAGKDRLGGARKSEWEASPRLTTWAELIYQSGSEAIDAARIAGRQIFKVKIRASNIARTIETGWRMRDLRRGVTWDIKEVDAITQRAFVFLVVEGPLSP